MENAFDMVHEYEAQHPLVDDGLSTDKRQPTMEEPVGQLVRTIPKTNIEVLLPAKPRALLREREL